MKNVVVKLTLASVLSLGVGILIGKLISSPIPEEEKVYALYNGTPIKAKEVLESIRGDLESLNKNIYDLKKRAVTDFVLLKLTDADSKAKDAAKADIQWKLPLPSKTKEIKVGKGSAPRLGSSAPVTLIVFSNYHCPYCSEGEKRLSQLKEKYKNKLEIYYRYHMDEPEDSLVLKAAEATLCAQDQNKFWEMHDLFATAAPKAEAELTASALKLNLNTENFEQCMKYRKHRKDIDADSAEAKKLGLPNPPVFVINGHPILGAQTVETISEMIDSEL